MSKRMCEDAIPPLDGGQLLRTCCQTTQKLGDAGQDVGRPVGIGVSAGNAQALGGSPNNSPRLRLEKIYTGWDLDIGRLHGRRPVSTRAAATRRLSEHVDRE
jgi:hypothetical protein